MTNPPDSIATGEIYEFRVLSVNSVGLGSPSTSIRMMPATLPGPPGTPYSPASSSESITIEWVAGTDGGSPITDYVVYWDNGIALN